MPATADFLAQPALCGRQVSCGFLQSIPSSIYAICAAEIETAPADADNETLRAMALASARVQEFTEGKTVRNVIVVPGRLVNVVVG